jgi:energy-coupling factor transporter ATP-binding protein EcfA2
VTTQPERHPNANPFSTRFVRPGAVPFVFGPRQCAADVVRRFSELGWRAQIVGPHGSGKSTLVATLVEPLTEAMRPPCIFSLRDRQRRMPTGWVARARDASAGTIVVDGYEQLCLASRLGVRTLCRINAWGLLVTAHADVGLSTLVRLVPDLEVARTVVAHLVPGGDRGSMDDAAVASCFQDSGGNIREMLFALYDRHERQRVVQADLA